MGDRLFGDRDPMAEPDTARPVGDEEILELTSVTMTCAVHAVMSRALRVEVAAPADRRPADLGREVADGLDDPRPSERDGR